MGRTQASSVSFFLRERAQARGAAEGREGGRKEKERTKREKEVYHRKTEYMSVSSIVKIRVVSSLLGISHYNLSFF